MKKIYFNDRFIAFGSLPAIHKKCGTADIYELREFAELPNLLNKFLHCATENEIYVSCKNEDETFVAFCDLFDMIFAGGGLVRNSDGDVLLIYRYQHWDLPKGKQEPGENIADTAVREVKEECGISNPVSGKFLTETYHCFLLNGRLMMKRNFWYEMLCNAEIPVPQKNEDIEKAKFVPINKLPEYFNCMYASVREVFVAAGLME
ncbi:MAG: NUDIX domain-containing protein [Prevotellaceae bacterium]|jgi:8-oxo-dGTP pyrophosphatase MutT (NUDIX family)|nr:NUDIX domain-containing protein [Prevotellaceae bacterium]